MDFIFYLSLFCLILFFGARYTEIDYDFWARLIVGKTFFQTGTLLNNDFYSYGTTHEFIDHEWGSSLIFYLIQNKLGDIGIFFLKSIIIFLTFFIITKTIRLQKEKISLSILFFYFFLLSISSSIFTTIRCQTFSFLFFVFYLYIFKYIQKTKNYKLLWCFPILNIIWANLHGGFVIGLVLILIFAIGEFLNKDKFLPYFYTFLLSCLTTLINPYGIKYIKYIIEAFSLNRQYIPEWQNLFTITPYTYTITKFYILLIISFILFTYSIIKDIKKYSISNFYNKIDKTKYLIIIFITLMTVKSMRCHVFYVYSILSLCYVDFYEIFNKKLPKIIDNIKCYLIFILIFIASIYQLYNYKFINTISPRKYPIVFVEFIKQNNLKGNVFSIFHTGSYIAYKLYPNNHVFMDGRYEEVYDNNLINDMGKFFLLEDNGNFIKKYHSDIFILDKTYSTYLMFKNNKNYILALEDDFYALYIDKKYKNKDFIVPVQDERYYNLTKFKTDINWN